MTGTKQFVGHLLHLLALLWQMLGRGCTNPPNSKEKNSCRDQLPGRDRPFRPQAAVVYLPPKETEVIMTLETEFLKETKFLKLGF